MSGLLSPSAVHDRTKAALAEWARTGHSYDEAAAILGIGHASMYRRAAGQDAFQDWTLRDLIRALCHAERVESQRGLLDQICHDIRGDQTPGHAMQAMGSAADLLDVLGRQIAALAHRLADQKFTPEEAKSTLAELPDLRRQIDSLEADCQAMVAKEHT